ncbi:MAG TPA: hypothetical protein VFR14_08645 [Candidatus Limnocylindrales bacterium]|nr:hypothetical protein [Candidatus Limnocylindrales bacterium]
MDDRSSAGDRDEAAAREARARYRRYGPEPLEPTDAARALLAPGEVLLGICRDVALELRRPGEGGLPVQRPAGDLYVTSERLIHASPEDWSVQLDEIDDAAVSRGRVLLVLHGGAGAALDTDEPRLVRATIATARVARIERRFERRGESGSPRPGIEAQANAR